MAPFENPYAPPQSDTSAPTAMEGEDYAFLDAPVGTRFANLLIDTVCRLGFAFVVGVVCGMLGISLQGQGTGILFGLTTMFAYYIVLEGYFGVTIGKLVTGTRVVSKDGGQPSFGAIVGRTFARFVPFEPFSFLGGSSSGWHDTWSGTRVIRTRR